MGGEKYEAWLKWMLHLMEFIIAMIILAHFHWVTTTFYWQLIQRDLTHIKITTTK